MYLSTYRQKRVILLLFDSFVSVFLFTGCAGSLLLRDLPLAVASGGYSAALQGPLAAEASLAMEHQLQARGLQQLWPPGSRAQARQSRCTVYLLPVRGLRRPGAKPVAPALARGFSTTEPPGKPQNHTSLSSISLQV